jgi:hypothetical protein
MNNILNDNMTRLLKEKRLKALKARYRENIKYFMEEQLAVNAEIIKLEAELGIQGRNVWKQ